MDVSNFYKVCAFSIIGGFILIILIFLLYKMAKTGWQSIGTLQLPISTGDASRDKSVSEAFKDLTSSSASKISINRDASSLITVKTALL